MASLGNTVVLFGGEDGSGDGQGNWPYNAQTWTFDGAAWTQHLTPAPSARQAPAMAPLHGKVVLFGGQGDALQLYDDTWIWDGVTWTQLEVSGPPARAFASMAALGDQEIVLFGGAGFNDAGVNDSTSLADTWIFDGTSWTEGAASGPPARADACWAQAGNVLVLFGGIPEDSWTFDGAAWKELDGSLPPGRVFATMATLPAPSSQAP